MESPKLIFSTSVEALLKASAGKISPRTEASLLSLGINRAKKLDPAYPAESWAQAVRLISDDMFPGAEALQSQRQLGQRTVMQFAETMVGKAMFGVAKLVGPMRSLQRLTHNLRSGANFIETKFTVIDEREQELWISDVSEVPGFYMGLIGAGADMMDGWADHMSIKRRDGAGCYFQLKRTK